MLRSQNARPLIKGLVKASQPRISYNASAAAASQSVIASHIRALSSKRPTAATVPALRSQSASVLRFTTSRNPLHDKADTKEGQKILEQKLNTDPGHVSAESSVTPILEASPSKEARHDNEDMLLGIKHDLATIKETFALNTVPKESLVLGAAGLLPYIATSFSTIYLAFDINHAKASGSGYLFSAEQAQQLLDMLEPIQIGYGAVIISFIGAVHWGLEYAAYGGRQSYARYAIGVIAPAIAWPTMLMPVEYALITQFLAFNFLYFHDARATVKGWCPPWYATYRFVLTFIVGASIVASLIGRGQIAERSSSLAGPAEGMKALRDSQWENLEKEEKERRKALAAASEEEESDEEEEEEEEEEDGEDDKGSEKKEANPDADKETMKKEKELQKKQEEKEAGAQKDAATDGAKVKGRGEIA